MGATAIGAALLLLALTACGQTTVGGSGSGSDAAGPAEIVGGPAVSEPAGPATGAASGPSLLDVTPGLARVRPVRWTDVEVRPGGTELLVQFWADPCTGVDSVDVQPQPERVVVTLHVGVDPKQTGPCPQTAEYRAVKVALDEPLGNRPVVDGAPGQGEATTAPTPL